MRGGICLPSKRACSHKPGEPIESLGVAHALHDADHEDFQGPSAGCIVLLGILADSHVTVEPDAVAQLVLANGHRDVDFIPQYGYWHVRQAGVLQKLADL